VDGRDLAAIGDVIDTQDDVAADLAQNHDRHSNVAVLIPRTVRRRLGPR
jgi:hypothetical protein